MIVETLVVSAVVVFVASLRFARWVIEYEDREEPEEARKSLSEKRALLVELHRKAYDEYQHGAGTMAERAARRCNLLSNQIAAMDDEEVRLVGGKGR